MALRNPELHARNDDNDDICNVAYTDTALLCKILAVTYPVIIIL